MLRRDQVVPPSGGGEVLVFVPSLGRVVGGSARWLVLGPLPAVHPAEVAKLALIVYLAHWLANRGPLVGTFRKGMVPFLVIAIPVIALTAAAVVGEPVAPRLEVGEPLAPRLEVGRSRIGAGSDRDLDRSRDRDPNPDPDPESGSRS